MKLSIGLLFAGLIACASSAYAQTKYVTVTIERMVPVTVTLVPSGFIPPEKPVPTWSKPCNQPTQPDQPWAKPCPTPEPPCPYTPEPAPTPKGGDNEQPEDEKGGDGGNSSGESCPEEPPQENSASPILIASVAAIVPLLVSYAFL